MAEPTRWRKIGMLLFLAMIVLGFTVPLFNLGGPAPEQQLPAEPRLCHSDADCYLLCGDTPTKILCSQNLCLQNACEEAVLYPHLDTPTTFDLAVIVSGKTLPLAERGDAKDFFVQFTTDGVQVFSSEFPLTLVLEKADIQFTPSCLMVSGEQYCEDEQHDLVLTVNGQKSYSFEDYLPAEGDQIEIRYSQQVEEPILTS